MIDKKELALIMTELGKAVKQEKSVEYKAGYIDAIMDFHNECVKKIKEVENG